MDPERIRGQGVATVLMQRVASGSDPGRWSVLTPVGLGSHIGLRLPLLLDGVLPLVRTTCGFVIEGHEVTGTRQQQPLSVELVTRPAGAWFDEFREQRVVSPPGHRWYLWRLEEG